MQAAKLLEPMPHSLLLQTANAQFFALLPNIKAAFQKSDETPVLHRHYYLYTLRRIGQERPAQGITRRFCLSLVCRRMSSSGGLGSQDEASPVFRAYAETSTIVLAG